MIPAPASVRWMCGDGRLAQAVSAALARDRFDLLAASRHRRSLRIATPDRIVLVKHFRVGSGPHPRREGVKARIGRAAADREWRALRALHRSGLPVPEPLALGRGADGDRLLAMAWVDGIPLLAALHAATPRGRRELLEALGRELERLHATGWAHGDLHPGNLLVCASGIVLLDWQRARPRASAADRARDLARLEHALAPFVPRTDRIRLRASALGCKRPFAAADRAALRAAGRRADHRAEEFARRRTGRLLRPGGEIVRVACGDRHGLRLRTLEPELLAELLAAHEAVLAAPDARVLKDDHRARVTGHALRGRALVVKEAPWRGLGRALADVVRGSAARRAWRAGHGIALRRIGVAVPQAWLERRRAGIPVRSWVVLEDLRPGIPAAFALEHGLAADAVLDALVRLLIDLHRSGIDHGDLQGTHVFLRETAAGLEGRLIDLEAVRFRSPLSEAARRQALAELNASLPDGFSDRDRCRAWQRYTRVLPWRHDATRARQQVIAASLARRHRWTGPRSGPTR